MQPGQFVKGVLLTQLLPLVLAQFSPYQNPLCSRCGCCPQRYVNPCPLGEPIVDETGRPSFCSWKDKNPCPNSYWCHVGASIGTTCCCQGTVPNPCLAIASSGQGTASITRWYYDSATRTCKRFVYRGLSGNENNFISRDACEQQCPVAPQVNPCAEGEPATDNTGARIFCSQQSANVCPRGFWCHIGGSPQTTVCCSGAETSVCNLGVATGTGTESLQRYYYDAATQSCKRFTYRGLLGNRNNFLSLAQCEDCGCSFWHNPCRGDIERTTAVHCLPDARICPHGHWCHVGDTPETTLCCPGAFPFDSICKLQMDKGIGTSTLIRWYYDVTTQSCRRLLYKGREGNQNNFLSHFECEHAGCRIWKNPCTTPTDRASAVTCVPGANTCPSAHWCHVGAGVDTTICCPGARAGSSVCDLPMVVGTGNANLPRWYYDARAQTCQPFTYRGLKGNQNSFLNRRTCQDSDCALWQNPCITPLEKSASRKCVPGANQCPASYWCHVGASVETTVCCPGAVQTGSVCNMRMRQGSGNATLSRWYYDSSTQSCQPFTYRGLKGNQNNFLSRRSCRNADCLLWQNPCVAEVSKQSAILCSNMGGGASSCPSGYWCHIGGTTDTTICCPGAAGDVCSLPMAPGTGRSSLQRWYYDNRIQACVNFQYGGLKGNQNNFLSKNDCQSLGCGWDNPCTSPLTRTTATKCSVEYSTCLPGFWCHNGATAETTVCCPGAISNPCNLPVSGGTGAEALTRWYADPNDGLCGTCKPFIYRGLKGNQNIFQSKELCEKTCPGCPNPCNGQPLLGADGRPQQCTSQRSCPSSYFCHNGATAATTTCCPSAGGNSCQQTVAAGEGMSSLPRWYFDARSQTCRSFTYRGLKGNANNFLSQQSCKDTCESVNPCIPPDRPMSRNGQVVQCQGGAFIESCPAPYFCHVGKDQSTTVCCPGRGNLCDQPRTVGIGESNLPRFYYDSTSDECRQFLYKGLQGNQNNFLSQSDCEKSCPGFRGYCPHGSPQLVGGQPQRCTVETACSSTHVCHVNTGPTISASICCPSPTYICFLPRDPGSGTEVENRYGYAPSTKTCVLFQYRGSGGNLNNFRTLEKCTEICCDEFQ